MSEIEVVKASKSTRRQYVCYKVVPGSRSSFPSAFILEDREKLAKRAVLSVRRGPIRYRRNSTIVCEGDPADYVFMVVDGVVRRCKTFQNGTRAIVAFHTPGELFGWTDELTHALSIEAATDALLLFFKRNVLLSAAAREHKVANFLSDVGNKRTAAHSGPLAADQPECKMPGCRFSARSVRAEQAKQQTSISRCLTRMLPTISVCRLRQSAGPSRSWSGPA